MSWSSLKLAPRWGRRAVVLGSATAVLAGAAAAPPADAAFTTPPCLGSAIVGRGASFQKSAQDTFKLVFENSYCQGISGSNPGYTYESRGSGAGRRVMGERTNGLTSNPPDLDNRDGEASRAQAPRYGATDEAPNPVQQGQMNTGRDASGDEGTIHVIPIAAGPVAALVNFPNNCDVKSLPAANQTNPAATDFTDRVRFTQAQFEEVWFGDSGHDQWGDIFPDLKAVTGNPGNKTTADCLAQAIKRAVRFDDGGTTFAFKDFLRSVKPDRNWLTTYLTPDSRTWPNSGASPNNNPPVGPNPVITGGANGNVNTAAAVLANDGSVGYADLAIARTSGFQDTAQTAPKPAPDPADADDTYWTQLPNNNGAGAFVEPSANDQSFVNGVRGGNCATTTYTGVPGGADPTLGNWFPATGVNAPTGWPICTLTYALAFDDNATAYGNTPAEEAKARTVKDFLTYVVSDAGQATLFPGDYGPVPITGGDNSLLNIARRGVGAIGFNKAGDASTGQNPPVNPPVNPPITNPPNTNPPSTTPSNKFSISSAVVLRSGDVALTIRVPGAGSLSALATAKAKAKKGKKAKTITVAKSSARPTRAGSILLTLKLTGTAKSALAKAKKLGVAVQVSFTPTGGSAASQSKTLLLKAKAKKKKKSKK